MTPAQVDDLSVADFLLLADELDAEHAHREKLMKEG